MKSFEPVALPESAHATGLCHYRALIEGVQCALLGELPDGFPLVVPDSVRLLLLEHGATLLFQLRFLFKLGLRFDPRRVITVGTQPRICAQTLLGALRAYQVGLTQWLEQQRSLQQPSRTRSRKNRAVVESGQPQPKPAGSESVVQAQHDLELLNVPLLPILEAFFRAGGKAPDAEVQAATPLSPNPNSKRWN